MKMRKLPIHSRGFTLVEISVSATLLGLIYWLALSGYVSSMKGSTTGEARLEALAENARALMTMNTELQEASVRDETVQIYQVDPDTGVMLSSPVDPADVPPPGTVFPTTNSVADNDFALRFMTVGDFTNVGDNMEVETAGPFLYRLGTGDDTDFRRDQLIRVDESGETQPAVLARGVSQLIFQRDSRGGAILITLITVGRDATTGAALENRQVLTVTPKNDFSENLANYDLHGQAF